MSKFGFRGNRSGAAVAASVTKSTIPANAPAAEADFSVFAGKQRAELVRETIPVPLTLRGKKLAEYKDGEVVQLHNPVFFARVKGMPDLHVEVSLPQGCGVDMYVGETGELVVEHDDLFGEKLLKLVNLNEGKKDAVTGKPLAPHWRYEPKVKLTLVSFNGHEPVKVEDTRLTRINYLDLRRRIAEANGTILVEEEKPEAEEVEQQ